MPRYMYVYMAVYTDTMTWSNFHNHPTCDPHRGVSYIVYTYMYKCVPCMIVCLCVCVSVRWVRFTTSPFFRLLSLQTQKLNVYKNDEMTWDFTAQGLPPSLPPSLPQIHGQLVYIVCACSLYYSNLLLHVCVVCLWV